MNTNTNAPGDKPGAQGDQPGSGSEESVVRATDDTVNGALSIPDVTGLSRAEAGRAYMNAGFAVFPVDGKMPVKTPNGGRARWSELSTTDTAAVDQWAKGYWNPGSETAPQRRGMALDAGKSGCVVLDVDRPELFPGEWWPILNAAPFNSTDREDPRRGHYLFRQPAEPVGCPPGRWGEVKGMGGYVVLPPSPHVSANADWPDGQTPPNKYRPTARYLQVRAGALPVLPRVIASAFGEYRAARSSAMTEDVAAFMAGGIDGDGDDPKLLPQIMKHFLGRTGAGDGRHPSMQAALVWAAKAAGARLVPATLARDTLESTFAKVKPEAYATEFEDMWRWAVGQATPEAVAEYRAEWKERRATFEAKRKEITEAGAFVRRLKLTPASEIEAEPVIWAWERIPGEGRIPAGGLTLAAGREGTGKSSFGIWLAARHSRGELPGTFYGQPKNVLYAAVEDSWSRTIKPRLMAAGADCERVFRVDVEDVLHGEAMISLPLDVDLIEEAIKENEVAALIIDPLMSTLNGGTDAHRVQDVRQALEPLVRMAERTKAMTLGIAHFNKSAGTDASQLISGSGAFKDLARAVLAFARDREAEELVMTQVKNSLGRVVDLPSLGYRIDGVDVETRKGAANVGRLVFTGPTEIGVEDMLSSASGEDRGDRDEAVRWLVAYLSNPAIGGEAPANEVIRAAERDGISRDALKRAKKGGHVESRKTGGTGAGWVWGFIAEPMEDEASGAKGAKGAKGAWTREGAPFAPFGENTTNGGLCEHCGNHFEVYEPGQTAHPGCTPAA